jgi:hypothetical protein
VLIVSVYNKKDTYHFAQFCAFEKTKATPQRFFCGGLLSDKIIRSLVFRRRLLQSLRQRRHSLERYLVVAMRQHLHLHLLEPVKLVANVEIGIFLKFSFT